jgi:hypothetical protein
LADLKPSELPAIVQGNSTEPSRKGPGRPRKNPLPELPNDPAAPLAGN